MFCISSTCLMVNTLQWKLLMAWVKCCWLNLWHFLFPPWNQSRHWWLLMLHRVAAWLFQDPGITHFQVFIIKMLVMYNKISAFWDWLDIGILFNPVVIFSYMCLSNLLISTWSDIYVKRQYLREALISTWSDNQMEGFSLPPKHYNRKRCAMGYFLKY